MMDITDIILWAIFISALVALFWFGLEWFIEWFGDDDDDI